ncbi:hypothetical protein ACFTSF_01215 [Kribbella sp. NPDC056951]|uniref:hypothetical protein n=1 Tax=Kribbella sp. NPDC056951 TaxID=3345978 RepID=UPI003642B67C
MARASKNAARATDMLAAGAHPIDAHQSLAAVTDQVVRLATDCGICLRGSG